MAGRGKRAYSMSAWTMRPYPPSSGIACFILHGGCHFCVVTAISHSNLGHAFTLHP